MVGWRRNGTLPPAECPPYSALETDPILSSNEPVERAVKEKNETVWSLCKPLRDEIIESFPTYWPIFTIASALIEIALVTMIMVTNDFAPVQFTTKIETTDVAGFGGVNVSVTKSVLPNPFVGPSKAAIIHAGGKYPMVSGRAVEDVSLREKLMYGRYGNSILIFECMRFSYIL